MKKKLIGFASQLAVFGVIVTALATTGAVGASYLRSTQAAQAPDVEIEDTVLPGADDAVARVASTPTQRVLGISIGDDDSVTNVPSTVSGGGSNPSTGVTGIARATPVTQPVPPVQTATALTFDFTPQTLATHNTAGNCYVAYNSTVYDVSAHPSWTGCSHHGASGGIDISSFFPHPTTYFNGMPVKGTYGIPGTTVSGGASNTSQAVSATRATPRGDDDDDEDEWEREWDDD